MTLNFVLFVVSVVFVVDLAPLTLGFGPFSVLPRPLVTPSAKLKTHQKARHGLPPSFYGVRFYATSSSKLDAFTPSLPERPIIDAVTSIQKKTKSDEVAVTASDASSVSGLSIADATRQLTLLTSMTSARLIVSDSGDISYVFPKDFANELASVSNAAKARDAWDAAKPKLLYGLKVSFGVTLLVSLVAIYTTIVVVSSSGSSDRDDDRRGNSRRGGGGGMGMNIFGPSPFDFFYYRPYGYRNYRYYAPPSDEMGFLESVFSYVFGDGDPNEELPGVRIRAAARFIRENGGVATAEQLAPFADDPPDDISEKNFVDEQYVLPILSNLGGVATVTDEGDIIYIFEELMKSGGMSGDLRLQSVGLTSDATNADIKMQLLNRGVNLSEIETAVDRRELVSMIDRIPSRGGGEEEYDEIPVEFSAASEGNLLLAGGLGVVNLAGGLYLSNMLSAPALAGVALPGYFGIVQAFMPFLLAYGFLFNAIPAVRFFLNKAKNSEIRERNSRRRVFRAVVSQNTRKIDSARQFKRKIDRVDEGGFDSGTDIAKDYRERELKEFDENMKR